MAVEEGYCCWPGQHAGDDGRCLGPPRCPGSLVAAGSDCVAARASGSSGSAVGRDGSFDSLASPARNTVDGGLLGGGITLILLGWLGSAITDTIGGAQVNTCGFVSGRSVPCAALPAWPFGWIPVLHPFAAINASGTWGGVAAVVGSLGAALEIGGLIMAIVGTIGHGPPAPGQLRTRLGASGADGGLTVELDF